MPVRKLKIEEVGDFWKGLTKPKIRLMGRWLERAGFKPGSHAQVACVALGVIELRAYDGLTEQSNDAPRDDPHSDTTTPHNATISPTVRPREKPTPKSPETSSVPAS